MNCGHSAELSAGGHDLDKSEKMLLGAMIKTAGALGLTVPLIMQMTADDVIQ
jgi:hypothetical protein